MAGTGARTVATASQKVLNRIRLAEGDTSMTTKRDRKYGRRPWREPQDQQPREGLF